MEMMNFELTAKRLSNTASEARSKDVTLEIDSGINARSDALSPMELLLASQAACFLKGIERTAPTLNFEFTGVKVKMHATRPVLEARIDEISYLIEIETNESDERLEMMHKNLKKHGTIYNTISAGTSLRGELVARARLF
jgi:uncharacterized OsmC-like protein